MKYPLMKKLIFHIFQTKGKRSLSRIKRNSRNAMKVNSELLMTILKRNKNTEFGKKYNFAKIKSVEEYRKTLPLSEYEVYMPYINEMTKGKKNLITTYPVVTYAETSGSSTGVQKTIPVTRRAMSFYSKYSMARAYALMKDYYHEQGKKMPNGSLLATLEISRYYMPDGTPREWISSATLRLFAKFLKFLTTSPFPILLPKGKMNMLYFKARFALEDPSVVIMVGIFMSNLTDLMDYIQEHWQMLVDDIEKGTISEGMCDEVALKRIKPYIHKNPKRAQELRQIFAQGFDQPIALKIWKNLSGITAVGTAGFASQTKKMKSYVGEHMAFDFSLLSPSEGMVAANAYINDEKFYLLVDSCFFEFIPVEDDTKILTVDQLEVGKDYEIVMTTDGGLYRYKLKDVVRVLGFANTLPFVQFVYRKNMIANIAGEKTSVEQLDQAVRQLAKDLKCNIFDYCIHLDTKVSPGRYQVLIEPDRKIKIKDHAKINQLFDEYLGNANLAEYKRRRQAGWIGMPSIKVEQIGTHHLWREHRQKQGFAAAQIKPVRLLDNQEKFDFFMKRLEKE